MPAVTSSRRLTRPLSVAAMVIVFLGFKLSTGDSEPASQLVPRGAGTVVETVPVGEPFAYKATIANTSDEPIELLQVQPLDEFRHDRPQHGRVRRDAARRRQPGARARAVVEARGRQTMETVEIPYVQGGKTRSVRMPFKLVACAAPAATCEHPLRLGLALPAARPARAAPRSRVAAAR